MTEKPTATHPREHPAFMPWKETNPAKVKELTDLAKQKNLILSDPLIAIRGGGIITPNTNEITLEYQKFLTGAQSIAIIPAKTDPDGKLDQIIRFPSAKESLPFDTNVAAYRSLIGDYIHEQGTQRQIQNPIPKTSSITTLPDGRFVAVEQYRPHLRGLGKKSGIVGIHELDTKRITSDQMRDIVHIVASTHPNATDFYAWATKTGRDIPKESFLHPENPLHSLRGQEWWVNPHAPMDRQRELKNKMTSLKKQFAEIDPHFDANTALDTMITNNLSVFPHQNGKTSIPDVQNALVVTHGTLYPDNIHTRANHEGHLQYTITGGSRAQGRGLPGQMIDWLVTACAESPAHQYALIDEFSKLYPSEINRRGLAMHLLYRSLMEADWFIRGKKLKETHNLVKLSYDILNGNGIWQGVNTPASPTTKH